VTKDVGGGTLISLADGTFKKKIVNVSTPKEGRKLKSPKRRRVREAVRYEVGGIPVRHPRSTSTAALSRSITARQGAGQAESGRIRDHKSHTATLSWPPCNAERSPETLGGTAAGGICWGEHRGALAVASRNEARLGVGRFLDFVRASSGTRPPAPPTAPRPWETPARGDARTIGGT